MMVTAKDLRDLRAAGAASGVSAAEVGKVWRLFAGGIHNKSTAMQLVGAATATSGNAALPSTTSAPAKPVASKPAAPTAPAEEHLASEVAALYLGKPVAGGRASGAAATSEEETLAAQIVSSYLGDLAAPEAAAPERQLADLIMASDNAPPREAATPARLLADAVIANDTAEAVAADSVQRYLAMKDTES